MNTNNNTLGMVPTKAMLQNKNNNTDNSQFQVVTLETKQKKIKTHAPSAHHNKIGSNGKPSNAANDDDDDDDYFDIKKARNEILRFGVSGLDASDKKAAKTFLAIKLGAKPLKKEYRNYKDVLEDKRKAKQKAIEDLALRRVGKNAVGVAPVTYKSYQSGKRKRALGAITEHYGVVNPRIIKKKKS